MNTKLFTQLIQIYNYSGSRLSEVQEAHPQPPPRSSIGDYDVPCMIRKRYTTKQTDPS
jgi:hypothetical protein